MSLRGLEIGPGLPESSNVSHWIWASLVFWTLLAVVIFLSTLIKDLKDISNSLETLLDKQNESYADIYYDIRMPVQKSKLRMRVSASTDSFFDSKKDV